MRFYFKTAYISRSVNRLIKESYRCYTACGENHSFSCGNIKARFFNKIKQSGAKETVYLFAFGLNYAMA